jgi:site-specific recombinase XerD
MCNGSNDLSCFMANGIRKRWGIAKVEAFLTHLAVEGRVSASTRPQRLPVVLIRSEVREVLVWMSGVHGLMTNMLYGTGMRLMECVRLWVKDVDFSRARF